MSDKPADSDTSQEGSLQEEVQDYLDMLLTQATEKPEAQVDIEPEQGPVPDEQAETEHARRGSGSVAAVARSLTMVGGTAVRSISPKPVAAKPLPWAEPPKPSAPPVKPITLKLPVVETRQAPPIDAPPTTAPAVEVPPVEVPPVTASPVKASPIEASPTEASPIKAPPAPPVETAPAPPVEPPPATIAERDMEPVAAQPAPESPVPAASAWLENGRPAWAQGPFECLLFSVGGLTLAVPLVELGTIYPMSEELTPIFGQVDWFMGLLPVKHTNIKTVNTAKVVMPERYRDSMVDDFSYVISINGVDWGLAVDDVRSSMTLDPADVRWRGSRSKRPWLAGTVVEHMCALLDVSQLAVTFAGEDRPRRR